MSTSLPPAAPAPPPRRPLGVMKVALVVVLALALVAAAVNAWRQWTQPSSAKYGRRGPGEIRFVEHARSNVPLDGAEVGTLAFVNAAGKPVDLQQYRGQKNVVLVVTRGNTSGGPPEYYLGNVCIYCSTQTSRLVANYDAIRQQNAEVVVVFPVQQAGDAAQLNAFRSAVMKTGKLQSPPPFPLVLDPELKAVNRLGIREDLSKPATYILDRDGQVRFAYVGKSIADRPSVQSILEQLQLIASEQKPGA